MDPYVWTTLVCAVAAVAIGVTYLVWARKVAKKPQQQQ
jgi:heme exporter protein D